MGERASHAPGTFSWVDLNTDDQEGAKAFYSALFAWQYEDIGIGEGASYTMAKIAGHSVAALGPLQGEGMPPHWNCYVTVADADASAARAAELGATLLAEPFDVFEAGRMAAFADPQGAVLSIWQAKDNIGAGLVNVPGALAWNDLLSPDVEGSAAFYRALFGWEIAELEGSGGQYWSIANDGRPNGGMMPMPEGGHPVWNLYFACEDVDATVAQAGALGARTIMPASDVPNGGRFAILGDPSNAVFSVVSGQMDP